MFYCEILERQTSGTVRILNSLGGFFDANVELILFIMCCSPDGGSIILGKALSVVPNYILWMERLILIVSKFLIKTCDRYGLCTVCQKWCDL